MSKKRKKKKSYKGKYGGRQISEDQNQVTSKQQKGFSAPTKFVFNLILMLVVFFIFNSFFMPIRNTVIDHSLNVPNDVSSAQFMSNLIETKKPKIVLVGNSMLGRAVQDRYFSDLIQVPTIKIQTGAAASAWWYLAIKNVVCRTSHKPSLIVVFFRDHFLTSPTYRTKEYKHLLDILIQQKEPVFDQLAYLNDMDWMTRTFSRYLAIFQKRDKFLTDFQLSLKRKIAPLCYDGNVIQMDWYEKVFDKANMNQEMLSKKQIDAETVTDLGEFDFLNKVNESFLPEIINLSQQHQIPIMFVRTKRRRDLQPDSEPPELKKYITELQAYLSAQQIPLIDFTHDERIELKHFAEGDHLCVPSDTSDYNGMKKFTELLAEEMEPYIAHLK